jgi:predicted HAD superfamily phosphohydrolase YqeG
MNFFKTEKYYELLTNTKNYLIKLLEKHKNEYDSIIVDVDDTLVFTDPLNVMDTAKYIKVGKNTLFIYPPITQIVELVCFAKKLGYKIIILTARPKESFLSTKFNLDLYSIPYDEIYMNNKAQHISFKYNIRQTLSKTNKVLFTIGDQVYDVNGPNSMFGVKLPSLNSYKVQLYGNIP